MATIYINPTIQWQRELISYIHNLTTLCLLATASSIPHAETPKNGPSFFFLTLDTLILDVTLNRIGSVNDRPCIFLLKILGCNVHSMPNILKNLHCVKDCEDDPQQPLRTLGTNLQFLGKAENFAPGWLLASSFRSVFQKNVFFRKILFFK